MIKTHGLTHIALNVRNPDDSLQFYGKVFGVVEVSGPRRMRSIDSEFTTFPP